MLSKREFYRHALQATTERGREREKENERKRERERMSWKLKRVSVMYDVKIELCMFKRQGQ